MINFDFDKYCYGCSNCADVCPVDAITMEYNEEGFQMPVIDQDKCIRCGKCERACIYLNPPDKREKIEKEYYAAYGLEIKEWLSQSASGGVFPALAKQMVEMGGYVCGCIWDENMEAVHIVSNDWNNIKKMFHSKYTQSKTTGCYREVEAILKQGKPVLFSGTPCQISAILSHTDNHPMLYTCDVICKGVPSPRVWARYIKYIENEQGSKVKGIVLRSKHKYGWTGPVTRYEFENGSKREDLFFQLNHFIVGFLDGLYMRNSCYHCRYKDDDHEADLVLGDFWGIGRKIFKKSKNKGISAVVVQTEKGKKLFDLIGKQFIVETVTHEIMAAQNPSMTASTPYNEKRNDFFEQLDQMPIEENIAQYTNYHCPKNRIIRLTDKIGLFHLFKWVQSLLYR